MPKDPNTLLSKQFEIIKILSAQYESMEDVEEGVRDGGELLKDVKYADDQEMEAQTEKRLQTIMDVLSKSAKEDDMKINVKKTKVIGVCKNGSKCEGGNSINIMIE